MFVAVVLLLLSADESALVSVSMGPEDDDWEGCCGGDVEAAMLVVGALAVAGTGFLARLNRALGAFLGGATVAVVVLVVATVLVAELGVSVDDNVVGDGAVKTADRSCIL